MIKENNWYIESAAVSAIEEAEYFAKVFVNGLNKNSACYVGKKDLNAIYGSGFGADFFKKENN